MRFDSNGVPVVMLRYLYYRNTDKGTKIGRWFNAVLYKLIYRNKDHWQEDVKNLVDRGFISEPPKTKKYSVNWEKFYEVVKKHHDKLAELPNDHPEHSDSIALFMALLLLEDRMKEAANG